MGSVLAVDEAGQGRELVWPDDESTLSVLQQAVDGCVYLVELAGDLSMWCNDEGLLNGSACNGVATILAAAFGARQRFFGPVVFTGGADAEGATLPLRDHQLEALKMACASIRDDLGLGE